MIYVLYNMNAGACRAKWEKSIKEQLSKFFENEEFEAISTIEVDDKISYISKITKNDKLVIVGGDGTLNHFINGIEDKEYDFPMYCYAGGTGNDFIHDVSDGQEGALVKINDYIHDLPVITVKGKDYKFINGIGYGIDGYCCEEGDKYKEKTGGKAPNYTKIALKGLLGDFSPVNATVTIDGKTEEYHNVWMVPSMNGRYFGGGMKITPEQDRLNADRDISVAIVTAKSRLRLLTVFPLIFKGKHTKYTNLIKIVKCKEVTVKFDRPIALQIDGETVLAVTEYTAKSHALLKKEEKEAAMA